uniref:VWFA domain-containing protein n=1 Tax=Parascaris univalens TaxID=6257 RepID=A0A915BB31_PARUN
MPSSSTTMPKNVQLTSSTQPSEHQQGQEIQPSKPVDLPPHTPISAPSLPGGKLAKGVRPSRIPSKADDNEVAPVEPEEVADEKFAFTGLPYFSGITATGAALNLSLEALRTRRPNVPTNVVVITDGFSYDIVDGPAEELHRLPNVRTFTVTVTDAWRETKPLKDVNDKIKPTLKYKTTKSKSSSSLDTSTSSSKSGEQEAKSCPFDIVIVLDASGSLQTRFQRQLELAVQLVDRLTIGPEDARVAVIKYAGRRKSKLFIPFNKYTDKESLEVAIKNVGFIGGTTYTNEALLKADEVLSGEDGRRSQASPIVVVFTDGFSHDDPASGATMLRKKGVPMYAVGINDIYPVNVHELLAIAGDESRVFLVKKTTQFENQLNELTKGCSKRR